MGGSSGSTFIRDGGGVLPDVVSVDWLRRAVRVSRRKGTNSGGRTAPAC
jgi:hypothetical protein